VGEMLLFTVIVSEVQCEGNISKYSDVCLRYRVGKILLCTVMCV